MKQWERTQSVVVLLLVLGVVTVLLVAGITSLNRFSPQRPLSIQSTGIPTYIDGSTFTPNVGTQKAIFHATRLATTRTPFPTQILFPTGTFEGDEVKFSAKIKGLDALNAWGGYMDGNTVVIYAGSLLDDQEQGAIEILIKFPYRFYDEQLFTPTRHGGIRVVDEENNRLTLQAADGEVFYFDVPARQFVASLTEVVSTATPPPSLTPPVYGLGTPTTNPYPMPTELSTAVPW
jgi:hypothetical protein